MKTLILLAMPLYLCANSGGPLPGYSGVPGENGTCASCHASGAASVNTKGGSVAIDFGSSQTYVPGQVQHWIVTIVDSSARRWGFEASARQSNAVDTVAGGFTPSDSNTQVICSSSDFHTVSGSTSGSCGSSTPLMYVEHTLAGTRLGTTGSITFQFDWTPPANDVGSVTVYIAANAANGNNANDPGDHVYSASYTLTPAVASTNAPVLSSVQNGASFGPTVQAGSWVTLRGTNLSTTTRTWTADDFTAGTPTSLDGVSVSMGGKPAYVYYISPTQINVQAPDSGTGSVGVTVTTSAGASNTLNVTVTTCAPAFFQSGSYAIATHADGSLVAPAGMFGNSSPAARGETIVLWGTGFGPVSPGVPAGQTSAQALGDTVAFTSIAPVITIGGVPLNVVAAALNPSALGLYQVAVTVPGGAASGDQVIVASAGGISSPASGVLFSVQ